MTFRVEHCVKGREFSVYSIARTGAAGVLLAINDFGSGFVLFAREKAEGWKEAAKHVSGHFGVKINTYRVGQNGDFIARSLSIDKTMGLLTSSFTLSMESFIRIPLKISYAASKEVSGKYISQTLYTSRNFTIESDYGTVDTSLNTFRIGQPYRFVYFIRW